MNEMISYCGLACNDCPTFIATKNNDDEARKQIADKWTSLYGTTFTIQDINCDGCKAKSDVHFAYCSKCEIRACANDRGFDTCAQCGDFACENLEGVFNFAPDARKRLEELRGESPAK